MKKTFLINKIALILLPTFIFLFLLSYVFQRNPAVSEISQLQNTDKIISKSAQKKLPTPQSISSEEQQMYQTYTRSVSEAAPFCNRNKIFSAACLELTKNFSLSQLAELAGTDEFWKTGSKRTLHYFDIYEQFISEKIRGENGTVIELGIRFGNSLRFWKRVFPLSKIVGFDLHIKGKSSFPIENATAACA